MSSSINNNANTALAIFFLAFAVVLIGGLVVIPAMQEAQAISSTGLDRRFGQQGEQASDFKRQGKNCELCAP